MEVGTDKKIYDYAIIGAGAAGLQLALAFLRNSFLGGHEILILDPDPKTGNDKTWCYWETGSGDYDGIIHKKWDRGKFITQKVRHDLFLDPYSYKMLRSLDFYQFARSEINKSSNLYWIRDKVKQVSEGEFVEITGEINKYIAKHVFDSRIPIDFRVQSERDRYIRILQHFKGWIIETRDPVFDPASFTMMDFRLKWKDQTSFTYILPFTQHRALVEFTLFDQELLPSEDYDKMLEAYIKRYVTTNTYTVIEVEQGVIPMSNFPFHKKNSKNITKIGTAGGWVRPSSGYSFRNSGKNAKMILRNIKENRHPNRGIHQLKTRFYDTIFLDILANRNELGEGIFSDMYSKNKWQHIFEFLDGESSIWRDIKILANFNSKPFLQALLGQIKIRI